MLAMAMVLFYLTCNKRCYMLFAGGEFVLKQSLYISASEKQRQTAIIKIVLNFILTAAD